MVNSSNWRKLAEVQVQQKREPRSTYVWANPTFCAIALNFSYNSGQILYS